MVPGPLLINPSPSESDNLIFGNPFRDFLPFARNVRFVSLSLGPMPQWMARLELYQVTSNLELIYVKFKEDLRVSKQL